MIKRLRSQEKLEKSFILLCVFLLSLIGCKSTLGPVNLALIPRKTFTLNTYTGSYGFSDHTPVLVKIDYYSAMNHFVIRVEDIQLTFPLAQYSPQYSRQGNSILLPPSDSRVVTTSGEGVGLKVNETLISPNEYRVEIELIGETTGLLAKGTGSIEASDKDALQHSE